MAPEISGLSGLSEVGRGGFGIVYRARDGRFGRDVAVKVIRDAGLGKDVLARFERECRALGSLSGHPNIVAVHDSGSTGDGEFFLVMEYLGGGSLAQRLAARGPAAAEDVVTWGAALAGALETAHRAGIVHRDVKPENILFSGYGAPKLVDFGIARMRSAYETRSGFISATLSHAAPEVVAGAAVEPAADVYSLASVLFTALHGRSPFDRGQEDSLAPLIARIASAEPPDLRGDGVPDAVAAVIERGLAKTPEDRFETAEAFGVALRDAARAVYGRDVVLPLATDEELAEAAALVEVSGDAGTVQRATPRQTPQDPPLAAAPLPAPDPAPAPDAQPSRRSKRLFAAVAAVLVIGGGGILVALTGGDEPGGSGPSALPSVTGISGDLVPGSVRFETTAVRSGPLALRRSYAFVGEDRVGTTVELRNTTAKPVTRLWTEVVPKDLAVRVGKVAFVPEVTGVIDEDPIVYWTVRIPARATRSVSWTTTIPAGREQGQELLDDVRAWHRAATTTSAAVLASARARLATGATVAGGDPTLAAAGAPTDTPIEPVGGGPGLESPGSDPTEAVPGLGPITPPGGTGPGIPTGPGGGSGPGSGGGGTANAKPVITVRPQTSNEMVGVGYTIGVRDPDGDRVTVRSVTGLPAGLSWSGTRISGTVSHSAANATTNFRNGLGRETRTVRVTVADSRGATATAFFGWTVVDTHRIMPNYIDKWGDGKSDGAGGPPSVYVITTNSGGACYHPSKEVDRIARQSKAPGSILRYGEAVQYTYYSRNTEFAAC